MYRRRQRGFYNLQSEVPFPGTVVPALWFDGNKQAYSDLAGALPVSSGLIRRLNEPAPLAGSWTTPADANRPLRDANSVRFDLNPTGGCQMTHAAVGGLSTDGDGTVVLVATPDDSLADVVRRVTAALQEARRVRVTAA